MKKITDQLLNTSPYNLEQEAPDTCITITDIK